MSITDQSQLWFMPTAYVKVFLQHAASEHLPIEPLLAGTSLSPEKLLTPGQTVSFLETRRVFSNVTRFLEPGWHLSLAQRLTISAHGALGFAAVTAPNLRASVEVLMRFNGIRGPYIWLAGAVEGEQFVIRLYELTDLGEQRYPLVELALLSIQSLLERPLGREIRGARIALAYPKPVYRKRLLDAFHADLVFEAHGHQISFPASWLEEPCVLHDEALHRYLVMKCEEDLRAVSGILPAEIAVRQALLTQPGRLPGLTEIARAQNVSARTLIRKLKRGKTSYNQILQDVRKTLAADYLLRSRMSISRISYRLGYQDPSNFGRAFRGWFGISPGQYRETHRTPGPAGQAQP